MSYFATDIYLDEDAMRRHRLDRKDVEKTAIDALLATGAVERVYTHADLRSTAPSSDPFLELFRNAFFEPRSPHLQVLFKREVYVTSTVGGTGHGSVYQLIATCPSSSWRRASRPGGMRTQAVQRTSRPRLPICLGCRSSGSTIRECLARC